MEEMASHIHRKFGVQVSSTLCSEDMPRHIEVTISTSSKVHTCIPIICGVSCRKLSHTCCDRFGKLFASDCHYPLVMDQQPSSDQTAETCYFTESSLVCYPLREEERVRLHASAGAKNLTPNILGSCSWPYYPPASLRCFNIILSLLCSAGFFLPFENRDTSSI
jgi:hypothetical protein